MDWRRTQEYYCWNKNQTTWKEHTYIRLFLFLLLIATELSSVKKKILFTTTSSATIFNSWSTLLQTWTNKLIKSVQQTSVESIWKRDHTVSYFYILPNIRFDTVHSEVSVYRVRFSCWRVNVCWSNLNCIQMHLTDLRCDLQTKLFTVDLLRTSINQIVKQHFFVIQYQMLWSAQNCTQDSQIENCID